MVEESWQEESPHEESTNATPQQVGDEPQTNQTPKTAEAPPAAPPSLFKADVGKRAVAAIVDVAIAFFVGLIPIIGGIVGAAYMALRDGFTFEPVNGQSFGKKLFDLRAVATASGKPCDYTLSIRRNLPFVIPAISMVFYLVPHVGWILVAFLWMASMVIEFLLALTDEKGERFGDKIAGTRVIEITSS